ncbi:hypothetical protein N7481_001355 [Penicillium waksmanii]|uniref:uncharacterized protein n=1 Tax=Penicillium waksmanii TaxID=69791 RepID=UPI002549A187|nr:uncharacterized protein N7481_001355 [Penicillium waksmanii]KAJ6000946.1 hypothetical protein N7481_001355 [Penicillium waksmanii]
MCSQPSLADKGAHEIDIAQVSLNLQSRFRLAKIKYQYGQLHDLISNPPLDSDKRSDSSFDFSRSGCQTPFKSPCHREAISSKTLPRSAHSKRAVSYNREVMQPILSVSRTQLRSDSDTESPVKATGSLPKSSYQRLEPSIVANQHLATWQNHVSSISEASVPNLSSPVYHGSSSCRSELVTAGLPTFYSEQTPHPTEIEPKCYNSLPRVQFC